MNERAKNERENPCGKRRFGSSGATCTRDAGHPGDHVTIHELEGRPVEADRWKPAAPMVQKLGGWRDFFGMVCRTCRQACVHELTSPEAVERAKRDPVGAIHALGPAEQWEILDFYDHHRSADEGHDVGPDVLQVAHLF